MQQLNDLLGPDDQLTLACSANLALDLQKEGAMAEAEALRTDTIRRYTASLGSAHPDVVAAVEGARLDFDFDPVPL